MGKIGSNKKLLLVSIGLLILLSGCDIFVSTEGFLNLKAFERWTLLYSLDIRASTIQLLGADISENLNNEVKKLEEQGLDASWEQTEIDEEGITSIILIVKGTGYDKLEILGVSVDEYKDDGKDLLKVNIDTGGRLSYQDYFGLKGGKIISTNGEKISSDTVRWINETYLEAVMEKPVGISLTTEDVVFYGLFIMIITILFIAVCFAKKKSREKININANNNQDISGNKPSSYSNERNYEIPRKPSIPEGGNLGISNQEINIKTSVPEKTENEVQERKFCPFCGKSWTPNASFCTYCGKQG